MTDKEYVAKRESLIPIAEKNAYRMARDKRYGKSGEKFQFRLTRLFHLEMNRLVKEAGL